MTGFLARNRNRSTAYAVIEPMSTVPVIGKSRMNAVLANAESILPSVNAVA
jgi:hypothetical protein